MYKRQGDILRVERIQEVVLVVGKNFSVRAGYCIKYGLLTDLFSTYWKEESGPVKSI
jgi:hypothetical protein